jgi:hypothetical protein
MAPKVPDYDFSPSQQTGQAPSREVAADRPDPAEAYHFRQEERASAGQAWRDQGSPLVGEEDYSFDQTASRVGLGYGLENLSDALGEDPVIPYTLVPAPKDAGDDYQPEYGVDIASLRKKVVERRIDRAVEAYRADKGEPDADAMDAIRADVRARATKDIQTWRAQERNIPTAWVDEDPEGTTQDLATWRRDWGLPGALWANFLAWKDPYAVETFRPKVDPKTGKPTYEVEFGESISKQGVWAKLAWLGRGAPSTVLATSLFEGDVGSAEQLRAVREGKDILSYAPEIGKWNPAIMAAEKLGITEEDGVLDQSLEWIFGTEVNTKEVARTLGGIANSLPLIFIEPDAISVGLFGVGKAYKIPKALIKSYRITKLAGKADTLEDARAVLGRVLDSEDALDPDKAQAVASQVMKELKEKDPAVAWAVGHALSGIMARTNALDRSVGGVIGSAMKAEQNLAKSIALAEARVSQASLEAAVTRQAFEKPYIDIAQKAERLAAEAGADAAAAKAALEMELQALQELDELLRLSTRNVDTLKGEAKEAYDALVEFRKKGWNPKSTIEETQYRAVLEGHRDKVLARESGKKAARAARKSRADQARVVAAQRPLAYRARLMAGGYRRAAQQTPGIPKAHPSTARAAEFAFQLVPRVMTVVEKTKDTARTVERVDAAQDLRRSVAIEELRALQLANMADELAYADLVAQQGILRRAGQFGGMAKKASPEEVNKLRQNVLDSYKNLGVARKAMQDAVGQERLLEAATKAFGKAQSEYAFHAFKLADEIGKEAQDVFSARVASASAAVEQSRKRLDDLASAITKAGAADIAKMVSQHKKTVKAATVGRRGKKKPSGRVLVATGNTALRAMDLALMHLSRSYRALGEAVSNSIESTRFLDDRGFSSSIGRLLLKSKGRAVSGEEQLSLLKAAGASDELIAKYVDSPTEAAQHVARLSRAGREKSLIDDELLLKAHQELRSFAEDSSALRAAAAAVERRRMWVDFLPDAERGWARTVSRVFSKAGVSPKVIRRTERAVRVVTQPAREVLGPGSDRVVQIGKGMLDSQRMLQKEMLDVVSKADPKDRPQAVLDYIRGETQGTVVNSVSETDNLWTEARALMRGMSEEDLASNSFVEAIANMWLPKGVEAAPFAGKIKSQLIKLIKKPESSSLSFEQMSDYVLGLTASNAKIGKKTIREMEELRALGYAGQAIGAMALLNRATRSLMAEVAGISEKGLDAVSAFTMGDNVAAGENLQEAFVALEKMGIPPKIREMRRETLGDISAGLVRFNNQADGINAIVPRQWMAAMSGRMGRIVKSTEEATSGKVDPHASLLNRSFSSLWRVINTSMTTGLLFAKPTYFANMLTGNMGQIWAETDLRTAARVTAQTGGEVVYWASQRLGRHIPFFGARLDRRLAEAANKYHTNTPLASITNAIFNPHIGRFFDPALAPANTIVRGKGGTEYRMGELREIALQEGVLTTFASEGLMYILRRTSLEDGGMIGRATARLGISTEAGHTVRRAYKNWYPHGQDMADWAEMRQRVALFTDLVVNQGVRPQEAGKIVRRALYDWGHAATSFEGDAVHGILLFYRFWKLALGQGARVVADPARRALEGKGLVGGAGSLVGNQNALSRVRQQTQSVRSMQELFKDRRGPKADWDGDGQPGTDRDEHLWMMNQVYPWWAAKMGKPWLTNTPLSPADQEYWRRRVGAQGVGDDAPGRRERAVATHVGYTMPASTPMETTTLVLGLMGSMMGAALAPFSDRELKPKKMARSAFDVVSGHAQPALREALDGAATALLRDKEVYIGTSSTMRQYERWLIGDRNPFASGESFPLLSEWVYHDPRDPEGVWRMDPAFASLLRMTPVLGTELYGWVEPLLSSPVERYGAKGAVSYLIRQWSGVGKQYEHNPDQQMFYLGEYRTKELLKKQKAEGRKMRAPVASPEPTTPSSRDPLQDYLRGL